MAWRGSLVEHVVLLLSKDKVDRSTAKAQSASPQARSYRDRAPRRTGAASKPERSFPESHRRSDWTAMFRVFRACQVLERLTRLCRMMCDGVPNGLGVLQRSLTAPKSVCERSPAAKESLRAIANRKSVPNGVLAAFGDHPLIRRLPVGRKRKPMSRRFRDRRTNCCVGTTHLFSTKMTAQSTMEHSCLTVPARSEDVAFCAKPFD